MGERTGHIEDPEGIRRVFQRLCRQGQSLEIRHGVESREVPVLAEAPGGLTLGLGEVDRARWSLKPGGHLLARIEDRGRHFEAILEMAGAAAGHAAEACRFLPPRTLSSLDEWSLADFEPDTPLPCTYTTTSLAIRDGLLRTFGQDGMLMLLKGADGHPVAPLRVGSEPVLDCALERTLKVVLPMVVAHYDDAQMGMRIRPTADPEMLRTYHAWLADKVWAQQERDRKAFSPEGETRRSAEKPAVRPGAMAALLHAHDPMVLVIDENDAFARHLAETLGRKFGVAHLDHIRGPVKPSLAALGPDEWGGVKLVLIHQRLRAGSGLELTRQLTGEEGCPLPILVMGHESDVELRRNRAIAAGAVDFIAFEPFHVLKVMKALEETLRMFA